MHSTKIATCCFCGSRSVLQLRELAGHHELACANCAAPISDMKPMKVSKDRPSPRRVKPDFEPWHAAYNRKVKPRKKRRFLEDFFEDILEDIWDEVEDIFD